MSQDNVELVKAAFDAYFRGDEPGLLELIAADVVITQFPEQVDVRDYHGHQGFRQVMTEWVGSWDDWSIEILGARELGDLVLATARQRGRGIVSGAPMDAEATFVFTMRGGLIARWQMFPSEAQALEAVGTRPTQTWAKRGESQIGLPSRRGPEPAPYRTTPKSSV